MQKWLFQKTPMKQAIQEKIRFPTQLNKVNSFKKWNICEEIYEN